VVGNRVTEAAEARAQAGSGDLFRLRQFPETGEPGGSGGPLPEQEPAAALDHQKCFLLCDDGRRRRFHRTLLLGSPAASLAVAGDGAFGTHWLSRQADGGAEFHQSLVETAGPAPVEQPPGNLLKAAAGGGGADLAGVVGKPTQHPQDIAVDNHAGLVESDTGDRRGSIIADPGQPAEQAVVIGKRAALDDLAGRGAQVAGPGVIAQAAPGSEQFGFAGFGQRRHRGEAFQETLVVGNDHGDARLLEHDFRDPDAIGITRPAPRQRPAGALVPLPEAVANGALVARFHTDEAPGFRPAGRGRRAGPGSRPRPQLPASHG